MSLEFNLKLDTRRLVELIDTINESATSKVRDDWSTNLEMCSGWLTDSTRAATASIVGTSLNDAVQSNRYGAPNPVDIMRPTLARFLGRNLNLFGGIQASPKTGMQEDKDQAESTEAVLTDKWERFGLDYSCMESLFYTAMTGHGYLLLEGDDTLSAPEEFEFDTGQVDPITNQPITEKRLKRVGDVVWEVLSPFQVAIDPGSGSVEESPWVRIIQFLTEDEVRRRWPELDQVDPETSTTPLSGAESAKYEVSKMDTMRYAIDKTRICVKRLFLKPDPIERPRGEQYVIVGKGKPYKIVDPETNQPWIGTYDDAYPVIDFRDEPTHVGYWSRGRQTSARPQVKGVCSVWSRWTNILSLPLFAAVPEGTPFSLSTDGADAPFAKIEYPPSSGPPSFLGPSAQLLVSYERYIDRALYFIGQVYGQGEMSRGDTPPARTPAESVRALQSVDSMADSVLGKLTLKSMTKVFQRLLGEGLRVWPEEYYVTVLGADRQSKSYTLRKKNLKPGVDIRILPGDENPKSKSALVKELTEVARWNLLPPKDFRRLLGVPIREDMYDPDARHIESVRREEIGFEEGRPSDIHWADDHELHKTMHERRSIERRNEMLGLKATPDQAAAYQREDQLRKQHTDQHMQALQAAAQAQVAAGSPMPGANQPGPPQPAQPQGAMQ